MCFPVEKKAASQELAVPPDHRGDARDGDLVAVEPIGRGERFGLQMVRVVERLGSLNSEKAISLIAIQTHDIPSVFKSGTLAEAEAVRRPASPAAKTGATCRSSRSIRPTRRTMTTRCMRGPTTRRR